MAAKVTQCTAAEVLPVTPNKGMVAGRILAHRGAANPKIPIHVGGHFGAWGRGQALVALIAGDGHPGIDLFDFADGTFFDQAGAEAVFEVGMDLVAHLGDHLGLRRFHAHLAGFPHGVGQRLLAIDVLAKAHGVDGSLGVHVVRRADVHRVELVAELGKHFAEVGKVRHAGMVGVHLVKAGAVDVAEADVLHLRMAGDVFDVAEGHAVCADGNDLEFRIRAGGFDHGRKGHIAGSEAGGFEEGTAVSGHDAFKNAADAACFCAVLRKTDTLLAPVSLRKHPKARLGPLAGRRKADPQVTR